MPIVRADGYVVPTPPDPDPTPQPYPSVVEHSFLVTITGADGQVWDLNNGPHVTLVEGTTVFAGAPITHWWGARAGIPGSRWKGVHYDNREPLLPITIQADDWRTWRDIDSAFWSSVIPEVESLITVTAPDGQSRYLRARLDNDGLAADDFDPLLFARKTYAMQLVSGQPLWEGDPVTIGPFTPDEAPFYPGPPFHFSAGESTKTATVSNPGDFPAWWQYSLHGLIPAFSIGVGAQLISSATPIPAGGAVLIDSTAGRRSIVDQDGNRVFQNMTNVDWAPIPAGVDVPLVVVVTGGTGWSVSGEFTPTYRRPW